MGACHGRSRKGPAAAPPPARSRLTDPACFPRLPHKIDLGAVFSAAPRDHKKYKLFVPLQRELVIDIDLTDYDFLEVDVKRLETCDR